MDYNLHANLAQAPLAYPRCSTINAPAPGPSAGPHATAARCRHCGPFLKWLANRTLTECQARHPHARVQARTQRSPSPLPRLYAGPGGRRPGAWDDDRGALAEGRGAAGSRGAGMMQTPRAAQVSIFPDSTNTTPVETVPLTDVLQRLQDGTYQQYTAALWHRLTTEDKAQHEAAQQPSVGSIPVGVFAQQAYATLTIPSGLRNPVTQEQPTKHAYK